MNEANIYRMKLVLGDWSDDGHGKSDIILLTSNYPVEKVQQAYRDACKLTGVAFSADEYLKPPIKEVKHRVATNYEERLMSHEVFIELSKFGFAEFLKSINNGCLDDFKVDEEDGCFSIEIVDNYTEIWTWFVTLSLPDLILKKIPDDLVPAINGYWGNLNVQFGYGLYY